MHNWCLEVWGDYACFTRPEFKVERVSYDFITPSAARAIFEAILWKPEIRWHITKIEVINPIKWVSIRRNEVAKPAVLPTKKQLAGELTAPLGVYIEEERQQRAGLFLKDVRYRIYGYFEVLEALEGVDTDAKFAAMFERRAKKGQCFHRPYLGCREFVCHFKLIEDLSSIDVPPISENKDFGYMLYDMNFADNKEKPEPMFYRAYMSSGTIDTDRRKVEVLL